MDSNAQLPWEQRCTAGRDALQTASQNRQLDDSSVLVISTNLAVLPESCHQDLFEAASALAMGGYGYGRGRVLARATVREAATQGERRCACVMPVFSSMRGSLRPTSLHRQRKRDV